MCNAVATEMSHNSDLPVRLQIYSLREILYSLSLPDSPFLLIDAQRNCIQHSHITDEDLPRVAGIADTRWRYECTTHELIPIFRYVDDRSITDFCDVQVVHDGNGKWVTPKGYPRIEPELALDN